MIPASGAGGREFDSRITPFWFAVSRMGAFFVFWFRAGGAAAGQGCPQHGGGGGATKKEQKKTKKLVRTGTRTQNLLLRRQAPYPLGHTDNYEFC